MSARSFLSALQRAVAVAGLLAGQCVMAQGAAEQRIVQMLQTEQPYHAVNPGLFELLGWDLPDGGTAVKALADDAPRGSFDPRDLEDLPPADLGYRASWHELRYQVYGLDWDIPALHLVPEDPLPDMPTVVIINGGASNWYEFFVDPLNRPGIGQYLAQKVPVLLVTIPGNYRHGGWTNFSYADRIPGYLLDRDVSPEEVTIRNAVYTFRVVTEGVKRLIQEVTTGPMVIVGHSTGGEIQFLLNHSELRDRLRGLSLGWGTGGPAGLESLRESRRDRSFDSYPDVWNLRARPVDDYAGGYLGPLNPFWDPHLPRTAMAGHWMGMERQRRAHFKQPLQDYEHVSDGSMRDQLAGQIRTALAGNRLGVDPEPVIEDLFTTMDPATHTGYEKMIWTVARRDTGHWDTDLSQATELLLANEFRDKNPRTSIRVLLFDLPMTHYGHIERPKQLAGGLLAALQWLLQPR